MEKIINRKGQIQDMGLFNHNGSYNEVVVAHAGAGMSFYHPLYEYRFQASVNALELGFSVALICSDNDSASNTFSTLSDKYQKVLIKDNMDFQEQNNIIGQMETKGVLLVGSKESFNALEEPLKDRVLFFIDGRYAYILDGTETKLISKTNEQFKETISDRLKVMDISSDRKYMALIKVFSETISHDLPFGDFSSCHNYVNTKNLIA
ncbi:MAG: hypothetical protein PHE67_00375 [Campylobacterales bacterium]|nr:hypothetical protein [Campylobacterales bacterium]